MDGQLNQQERAIVTNWVKMLRPERVIEVGTWYGGGSTLHILMALEENRHGHLWGIEACDEIYDRMISNIRLSGEELVARFTPVFGFSQRVIPEILKKFENGDYIDLVFLDGGDNPMEQIDEFRLLMNRLRVGGVLLSHDAKLRKGKWLVPYLRAHDNWECNLHDISDEGLFEAKKIADEPSAESKRKASATLTKLRLQPTELLGYILPTPINKLILSCLPHKLALLIGQGRKSKS